MKNILLWLMPILVMDTSSLLIIFSWRWQQRFCLSTYNSGLWVQDNIEVKTKCFAYRVKSDIMDPFKGKPNTAIIFCE